MLNTTIYVYMYVRSYTVTLKYFIRSITATEEHPDKQSWRKQLGDQQVKDVGHSPSALVDDITLLLNWFLHHNDISWWLLHLLLVKICTYVLMH